MDASIRSQLSLGADELAIPLADTQLNQLCDYLHLLEKWNRAYNLTAVKDPQQMVGLHILDSLAICPYIQADRLIDVGTGAGLPGIVMAIHRPEALVTLLDSNGKKTRFLNQVKLELALGNLQVVHSRVEDYQMNRPFDGVLSRAFASLKDMADNAAHLLAEKGRFWAMKGRYPQQEIDELDSIYRLESARSLRIPTLSAERHLIELSMSRENLD